MLHHRLIRTGVLVLGLGVVAGSPALAQKITADDVAYCNRLSAIYNRYLGDSTPSMETMTAEANCTMERAAEAIPQLEKLLVAKGYKLPEHTVGHQQ